MKVCPVCRTLNNDENVFCISCGDKIEEKIIFCKYCGSKTLSTNKFCKSCGKEVKSSIPFISDPIVREPSGQGKSNKKLIVTLSVIGSALVLGLVITLILVFGLSSSPSYNLSPEQQKLISSLGHPGEFVIIFDRETGKRVDMWMYPELERYFMFENGIYTGGKETVHPDLKKDKINVKPENFTTDMKIDDVIKVIGVQPLKTTDSKSGITALSFFNGLLTVAFNEKDEIVNITRIKEIN